jgi:transposase-like protein
MISVATQETEVIVAKAKRRRFSAKYKLSILRRAEACKEPGAIGELLRKEGLYSSHLTTWRRERDAGEMAGLEPRKRGPKVAPETVQDREMSALRRENASLKARLERAELLVEIQKKVSMILGVELPKMDGQG